MRVKSQNHHRLTTLTAAGLHFIKDLLVTLMDAIEGANRELGAGKLDRLE
jgi:hypothetical protein